MRTMSDLTQTQREIQLKTREDNLKSMQELNYAEHVAHTETIRKVSKQIIKEMQEAGHICVRGEQIARIETKVDIILERQASIKQEMDELFTGRNSNSKRIDRIETIGMGMGTIIAASWAVILYLSDKLTWK